MKIIVIMIIDAILYLIAVVFLVLAIFKVSSFVIPITTFIVAFLLEMGIFVYEIKHAASGDNYEDNHNKELVIYKED